MEFDDDRPLSPSKASDMDLRMPSNGKKDYVIDFEDNVVAVHFESSYSRQDNKEAVLGLFAKIFEGN